MRAVTELRVVCVSQCVAWRTRVQDLSVASYVADSSGRGVLGGREPFDVFSATGALAGGMRGASPPVRFPGSYLAPTLIGSEVQ